MYDKLEKLISFRKKIFDKIIVTAMQDIQIVDPFFVL